MHAKLIFWVMAAGALGSGLRFVTSAPLNRLSGGFPWGTFAVNMTGALAIGFVATVALEARWLSRDQSLAIMTGFLGGLTTFSSFAMEGFALWRAREFGTMVSYMVLSLVLGLLAVWLGTWLGHRVG